MSGLLQGFQAFAFNTEEWCPIYTPFWSHEVIDFVDLPTVVDLDRLNLSVFETSVDDPSARSLRLSFWGLFRLRAMKELGLAAFERMVENDTLLLWEDHVEACIEHGFAGRLSMRAALYITLNCPPEHALIPSQDWMALCMPFRSATVWTADLLRQHRLLGAPGLAFKQRLGRDLPPGSSLALT